MKQSFCGLLCVLLVLAGCSGQGEVQASCSAEFAGPKVTLSFAAPGQDDLLSSMTFGMEYTLEQAEEVTGMKEDEQQEMAAALQQAMADTLGLDMSDVQAQWHENLLSLSVKTDDVRGALGALSVNPSSLKFKDVLSSMNSSKSFACVS